MTLVLAIYCVYIN